MDQHTYSFPKVTPADPDELRERLRVARRAAADAASAQDARPVASRTDAPRRDA
ncbi:MAG: hypothetical protein M0P31_12805 [Solirubrobacteraceae bacterium]|nr:hypothetical protein [Solirubrobacteraceae bacterium]